MGTVPTNQCHPVIQCPIAYWHGAREPGHAGVSRVDGYSAFVCYEIPALPDFSSPRFADLSRLDDTARVKKVGERQAGFISTLHVLGPGVAVSLRYLLERGQSGMNKRIRLFLVGRAFAFDSSEAKHKARQFCDLVESGFPMEYYPLIPINDPTILKTVGCGDLDDYGAIAEILKPELNIPAHHQFEVCGFRNFYVTSSLTPLEHGALELCRTLIHYPTTERAVVDCCITPTPAMTEAEAAHAVRLTQLAEKWSRDQRKEVGGGLFSDPMSIEIAADPNARWVNEALSRTKERYSQPDARYFVYACRVLADSEDAARAIAATWASFAAQRDAGISIISCAASDGSFSRAVNAVRNLIVSPSVYRKDIWNEPDAPETLRRLHRMADVKELSTFFRLPIPGATGCPGIMTDYGLSKGPSATSVTSKPAIEMGQVFENGRTNGRVLNLELPELTKHCLIVGTPGSGKTTLSFSLLTQLWEKHRIPFVVLEPAKTEYRALKRLAAFRDDLLIFTVGNERVSPFRFNPLEPMDGVELSEHISTLKTCFKAAFSLFDPLPMILSDALQGAYEELGWSLYDLGGENPEAGIPTLDALLRQALAVLDTRDYKGEVSGNLRGAIQTRLGSLINGPKGRCFNTVQSVPVTEWMKRPVIFELDALNLEEKALMMMFILTQIRAYAKVTPRSNGKPLRHVVLVEEAHNVIPRRRGGGTSDSRADPQAEATQFFTSMLAEMRALGEGMLVCDQLPTAVAEEAVKLTDIKVMHRIVSADDRVELGASMIMNAGQIEQAALLEPGYSFVFKTGSAKPDLVKEINFKLEHGETDRAIENAQVTEWMRPVLSSECFRKAYLPYDRCGEECTLCDSKTRERAERLVNDLLRKNPKMTESDIRQKIARIPFDPSQPNAWHCISLHFHMKLRSKGVGGN
ncbi:ATP-binding protein [Desulforhabdus sp. TSK]|uniref:ATP-binding protein n=1 Tax=Desulforhabdus sp. TSK TaxID=2925014 RepID=UPI001FC7EA5E|nr:DUF87 domain-containing protein [Desulforhabdus sp. TSK]GKT09125.1 hypothetical protein DSTSK_24300 [Desulforhabdus sp. TSK]